VFTKVKTRMVTFRLSGRRVLQLQKSFAFPRASVVSPRLTAPGFKRC